MIKSFRLPEIPVPKAFLDYFLFLNCRSAVFAECTAANLSTAICAKQFYA
jgi:hypothetical protein